MVEPRNSRGDMGRCARRSQPRVDRGNGLSVRYNEDLDPNQGPGFGCFVTQAILFALILLLIPVGLFAFNWPVWLLAALLFVDLILLFFVSMTSVARQPTRVITTDEEPTDGDA